MKLRKNKIFPTLLCCLIFFTFIFPNNIVHALSNKKTTNFADAIKLIEKDYLIKNNDGTSEISVDASDVVDSKVLTKIEQSMNSINDKIKNKKLYVVDNQIKNSPNYNPDLGELKNEKIDSEKVSSRKWGLDSYTIKYTWKWWGFYAYINSNGCRRLVTSLSAECAIVGGAGYVLNAVLPGIGAVIGVTAAISVGTMQYWGYIASDQADMGLGVTCTCLGSPEDAELTNVVR